MSIKNCNWLKVAIQASFTIFLISTATALLRIHSNIDVRFNLAQEVLSPQPSPEWDRAVFLQRGLETIKAQGKIPNEEYKLQKNVIDTAQIGSTWLAALDITSQKSQDFIGFYFIEPGSPSEGIDLRGATKLAFCARGANVSEWISLHTLWVNLDIALAQGQISDEEYHQKTKLLLARTESLAKQQPLSSEQMAEWHKDISDLIANADNVNKRLTELEAQLKTRIQELQQATESRAKDTSPSLYIALVSALVTLAGAIFVLRKDRREAKEMKWKEREWGLKISQLEETKELQLQELRLKVLQLERQLEARPEKLILVP